MTRDQCLGFTFKDHITGFQGVAIGICYYLTGCTQILLTPKGEKNLKTESHWFDIDRLKQVGKDRLTLNVSTNGSAEPAPKK